MDRHAGRQIDIGRYIDEYVERERRTRRHAGRQTDIGKY